MTDFVTVATTDELADGDRLVVELNRKWIVLFNIDGQYYAIEDRCTHDDGELASGEMIGCEIICARHGARFDVRDGRVTHPPALVDVPAYQTRVIGNEVQVGPRKMRA